VHEWASAQRICCEVIMQNYFSKLKTSATELANKILTESRTPTSSTISTDRPSANKAELLRLFRAICDVFDAISKSSVDAHSVEAERKLNQSKVREYFGSIILILKIDREHDHRLSRMAREDRSLDDAKRGVCIDAFVQNMMVQELCNRAIFDSPRGTMPIVLNTLANLIRTVDYPFLPLASIYKPIGKLISVTARFDAIYSVTSSNEDFDSDKKTSGTDTTSVRHHSFQLDTILSDQQTLMYPHLCVYTTEIGLTALLSILWRKIAENPPILDYFTFSDIHKRYVLALNVYRRYTFCMFYSDF
jgi:hypothetical protein